MPEEEDDNLLLLVSIKDKMENVSLLHCICRVPESLSKGSQHDYFPKLVSIGPFHRTLTAMEAQKWRYLHTLLNRKPDLVDETLRNCVSALKGLEAKIRKCYGEEIPVGTEELVTIMLLDGCFIIELLFKYSIKVLRRRDDPMFKSKDKFFRLRSDMLLLENQIPFFVLQCLFNLVPIPQQCTRSLTELAFSFFKNTIPGNIPRLVVSNYSLQHLHFLDFIHNCYLPTFLETPSKYKQNNLRCCATKLQESGIKFKKAAAAAESLLDMEFVRGEIRMPPLKVKEYTEVTFRNLIAYENRCPVGSVKYITSYVCLLKSLVQSEKDAKLLSQARILTNTMGSGQDTVLLIQNLYVEVGPDEFFYKALCEQVNDYYNMSTDWWHKVKHAVLCLIFFFLCF